jgi:GNAT superfamily N-acetyltransferase
LFATSSTPEWRVVAATRVAVERDAETLAALDAELREELGDVYSDEPWTVHEFLAERPGKWQLSRLVVTGGRPCGFWIASMADADAHTHRVGISGPWRGRGLGAALAEHVHRAGHLAGARRMTMYVSPDNHVARAAYACLGYRPCTLSGRPAMERFLCE